ncbi:MAG: hypothetical protein ACT6R7_07630 [Brevundimonas aurantiaca]|jgi:hypothetical protein|uniref:hypothetical protein n=1 Tax=Brevundimonas aurantiaca TaxID=74316 RepID=UPI0040336B39
MPSPAGTLLIGATAALLALCLAQGLGLISPKRFAQLVGGAAGGIALVSAGVWLAEGSAHG